MSETPERPNAVRFVGSSRDDLRAFPKRVRRIVGQALFDAQNGRRHPDAKVLAGFGGAGVLEVVEDDRGGTYRAVYTVKFRGSVFVLHVFQKKSKRGIKTPAADLELIRRRLRRAEEIHGETNGGGETL